MGSPRRFKQFQFSDHTGRQIMEQTSEFDQILFSMYDHLEEVDTSFVLSRGIPSAPRRQLAYLQYLRSRGKLDRFCADKNVVQNLDWRGMLDHEMSLPCLCNTRDQFCLSSSISSPASVSP
jgi:hypothetical protein